MIHTLTITHRILSPKVFNEIYNELEKVTGEKTQVIGKGLYRSYGLVERGMIITLSSKRIHSKYKYNYMQVSITLNPTKLLNRNKLELTYKYLDDDVYNLTGFTFGVPKARDYVSWLERKFNDRSDHIYKGEQDNEDLSDRNEEYIWSKLKDKIYDSSITIVLISPKMKEYYRWESNQWIPWEISYSLKEITRNDLRSRSNSILAVVLPNRNNDYYKSMNMFRIISENIRCGYIPVVTWDKFKYNCDYYINLAYNSQKITPMNLVTKRI